MYINSRPGRKPGETHQTGSGLWLHSTSQVRSHAGRLTGTLILQPERRIEFDTLVTFLGGGMNVVEFRTDDGGTGHGVCECTGEHHHRRFPGTERAESRDVYYAKIEALSD